MSGYHLGINMGHDRSVAIVKDGRVAVAIEQERLDRVKHSVGFILAAPHSTELIQVPGESIAYCLDTLGLPLGEMETITANMPGVDLGPRIMRSKFSADLAAKLKVVPSHHLAHAYTAYWPSGFEEALVLVVDASGSVVDTPTGRYSESYSLYEGRGSELRPIHSETVQSHLAGLSTLGFVYEEVTRRAGFETRLNLGLSFAEAGKLMGLAAYGGPQPHWEPWLRIDAGSTQIEIAAYDIFLEMAALEKRYDNGDGPRHFRPWLVDLAYKAQAELERALSALVAQAKAETGLDRLCIAGGVGLNSVANYKILESCNLRDIFVFPAAADNGIAVGCALWAYHAEGGGKKRPVLDTACFGRPYSSDEIDAAIAERAGQIESTSLDSAEMVQRVSEALAEGNIVARYEGGCEFGPRALGHRSILADPTFERMKDVVNARVKFREAFRPFAPVVPLERASEVFDLTVPSPYMLLVAPVRAELRDQLPAITHEDGTGRVQTTTPESAPFLHAICNATAEKRGGVPVLLNTSFNVAGQPIVESPAEAIRTFLRTDIDFLALEDRWIWRKHQPVKDYAEHVRGLEVEPRPSGLGPNQPSVRPMMEDLDAAIFDGQSSRYWRDEEIDALSEVGARYRETSRLFRASPTVVELKTRLGPHAELILDPRGISQLADPSGSRGTVELDWARVELVLSMAQDGTDLREDLCLRLQLTPSELEDLVEEAAGIFERFDLEVHPSWQSVHNEETSISDVPRSNQTLGAFVDPELRLDAPLSRVRKAFFAHGYAEENLCALLDVESLQQIEPTHLHYYDSRVLPETPIADLARLFLLRAAVPTQRLTEIFDAEAIECLDRLGMIKRDGEKYRGCVDLYCSDGLLIATDHRHMIRPEDRLDEDPVMYIGMDSHGLVQTAPRERCGRVLDLCCGSGIQGLVASRYAREVVAVDLSPRAVRFSRFNAQLNGVKRYRVLEGDLYAAVPGQQFDCILANPPFVPSPEEGLRFRDGGATGEHVLQAIVAGANEHLNEQGRLCIVTDLVDTERYEDKLGNWLGEVSARALILTTADRDEILFSVPHCHAPFAQGLDEFGQELERWVDNFRSAGLVAVNFGYIFVWKRVGEPSLDLTMRTLHNPNTPIWGDLQQWVDQRMAWESPEAANAILTLHPGLRILTEEDPDGKSRRCELKVPGNPFYTTYSVSPLIADELRRIHRTQPELGRRLVGDDAQWVERLHRLGLLRLSNTRRPEESTARPETDTSVQSIDEQPTKTTPTCLTSYLR